MMKDLAEKLFLGVRNIPQYPFGEALEAPAAEAKESEEAAALAELDPLNKLIKNSEALVSIKKNFFIVMFQNVRIIVCCSSIFLCRPLLFALTKRTMSQWILRPRLCNTLALSMQKSFAVPMDAIICWK